MKSQVFRFMRKTQANSSVGLPTTQQGQGKGKANKDLLNDIKGTGTQIPQLTHFKIITPATLNIPRNTQDGFRKIPFVSSEESVRSRGIFECVLTTFLTIKLILPL